MGDGISWKRSAKTAGAGRPPLPQPLSVPERPPLSRSLSVPLLIAHLSTTNPPTPCSPYDARHPDQAQSVGAWHMLEAQSVGAREAHPQTHSPTPSPDPNRKQEQSVGVWHMLEALCRNRQGWPRLKPSGSLRTGSSRFGFSQPPTPKLPKPQPPKPELNSPNPDPKIPKP